MKLKSKISMGLGFLFGIIFLLVFFCMYYIGKISNDSENILKNNYNSVEYAKNMASALDESYSKLVIGKSNQESNKLNPKIFKAIERTKSDFEKNLGLEKGNITETNEQKYVDLLSKNFERYIYLSKYIQDRTDISETYNEFYMSYRNSRLYIDSIFNINMEAIIHKNQFAKKDADDKIMLMAVVGTICVILAFFYFWYFPFFVSNSVSILAEKMKQLLMKAGIKYDSKTNDESYIILEAIDLLEKNIHKS